MPTTIDGTPIITSAAKRDRAGEAAAPMRREVESRADSDRHAHQARQADKLERADDRVGHPAALLAHRRRHVGEKRQVEARGALGDQVGRG